MRRRDPQRCAHSSSEDGATIGPAAFARKYRKEFIVGAVIAVIAVAGVGGYELYKAVSLAQERAADEAFRQSNTQSYAMGQTLDLNSQEDDKGQSHGYVGGFDWKGTMQVTLVKAGAYDSPDEAGLKADKPLNGIEWSSDTAQDNSFVLCEVKLKNVDAVGQLTAGDLPFLGDEAPYAFTSGLFDLASQDPSDTAGRQSPSFGEGLVADAPANWVGLYTLKPGEEKTLKLGYIVPKSFLKSGMDLQIGAAGSGRYAIPVDLSA